MEGRIKNLEDAFGTLRDTFLVLQNDLATVKTKVDENDQGLKQEIVQNDNRTKSQVQQMVADIEARLAKTAGRLEDGIGTMIGKVSYLETAVQQVQQGLAATSVPDPGTQVQIDQIKQVVEGMNTKVTQLETRPQGSQEFSRKPLMDSRVWDPVVKLSNDKAMFRDWKMKVKSALKQVTKVGTFRDILNFLEDSKFIKEAQGLTREKLQKEWLDHMTLNGAPQGWLDGDWAALEDEVDTILMDKTGDRTEASLILQREIHRNGEGKAGLLAWTKLNVFPTIKKEHARLYILTQQFNGWMPYRNCIHPHTMCDIHLHTSKQIA